jgi:predicted alpha/beta hydrolase
MHTEIDIKTKDGSKIGVSCYVPAESIRKVMIIAPTGELTKKFYDPFARFMQQNGFTVITFDYRGMGSSAPEELKGYKASMHQWAVLDIDSVILYAKNNYANHEIIYVGHCIGGETVGLAQASQYINKLILVNSALSCKKFWSLRHRFKVSGMKAAIWTLSKLFGYFPGKRIGYAENLPGGVMNEWAGWCSMPNGLFDLFPDNNYRKLQIPLLAYSFSDNPHSPPKAVEELLNHFAAAFITWRHLRPKDIGLKKVGHSGFFEPFMETRLWGKMLDWINENDFGYKRSINTPLTINPGSI